MNQNNDDKALGVAAYAISASLSRLANEVDDLPYWDGMDEAIALLDRAKMAVYLAFQAISTQAQPTSLPTHFVGYGATDDEWTGVWLGICDNIEPNDEYVALVGAEADYPKVRFAQTV